MRQLALICVSMLVAAKGPAPTQNGDTIGWATMRSDKSVSIALRSVECDGTIAEAQFVVSPDEPRYNVIIKEYEVSTAGENKRIIARDLQPCVRESRERPD